MGYLGTKLTSKNEWTMWSFQVNLAGNWNAAGYLAIGQVVSEHLWQMTSLQTC